MSASLKPKPKACKFRPCGKLFTPSRSFVTWCSPDCGWEIARAKKEQAEQKARSEARKKDRETRDRLKKLSEVADEAQDEVNRYVRLRDASLPCISCGTQNATGWHAGHYLSRGARPELRFNLDNIHKQCRQCNYFEAGNVAAYRVELVRRIGEARVQALEGPHPPAKFTREYLRELQAEYRRKARELEKEKEEV